jgi:putative mRNA 3-end processing factor
VRDASKAELAGTIALCPPSSLQDRWTRRFPDPVSAFASGWMRVRARARQRGVELPLVISDHADWDGLCATIAATGASQIWVTHGAEEALVHWCTTRGLEARPLGMVGYGDEDEGAAEVGDGDTTNAGGLPLPHSPSKTGVNALTGERVGVRGSSSLEEAPSPGAQERADLSPKGRGEERES